MAQALAYPPPIPIHAKLTTSKTVTETEVVDILMKFSSLVALGVAILTTSSAISDSFPKMTVLFQWLTH